MSEDQISQLPDDWMNQFDPGLKELASEVNEMQEHRASFLNYDQRTTLDRQQYSREFMRAKGKTGKIDELLKILQDRQPELEQNAVLEAFSTDPDQYAVSYAILGWDIDEIRNPQDQPIVFNPLRANGDRTFTHCDAKTGMLHYYELEETRITYTRFNPMTDTEEHDEIEGVLSLAEAKELAHVAEGADQATSEAYRVAIENLKKGEA